MFCAREPLRLVYLGARSPNEMCCKIEKANFKLDIVTKKRETDRLGNANWVLLGLARSLRLIKTLPNPNGCEETSDSSKEV